jgi:hypothetical protein
MTEAVGLGPWVPWAFGTVGELSPRTRSGTVVLRHIGLRYRHLTGSLHALIEYFEVSVNLGIASADILAPGKISGASGLPNAAKRPYSAWAALPLLHPDDRPQEGRPCFS